MMEFLRGWVLSVSAAGLVLAILLSVLPKGSGRQIVKLAGGVVLSLVIFSPLTKLNPDVYIGDMEIPRQEQEERMADMQRASEKITKEIIQAQTSAYIVNKAQALGLSVRVQVGVHKELNGLFLPDTAVIQSSQEPSRMDRDALSAWMADALGIPVQSQDWRWEE